MNVRSFFNLLLLFILGLLFTSCISNKKVTLFQSDDLNVKGLPKDSVVRSYTLDSFQYKVQPNDILYVKFESLTPKEFDFFSDPTSTQNMTVVGPNALVFGELVDDHGEIPLPVIGKLKVAGMTVFEVQEYLQRVSAQYTDSPIVKVRLINYRITVLGEVVKEGTLTLSNNRVSMLEALGLAGGLGELADRENIKLIRQRGGMTEVHYLNLLDENFFNSPYYYVYQNDVLIVPPLKQRPFRKYFGQNLALVVSSLSLLLLVLNLTN
jgi:polysaccharide biosynthesis/export protein